MDKNGGMEFMVLENKNTSHKICSPTTFNPYELIGTTSWSWIDNEDNILESTPLTFK